MLDVRRHVNEKASSMQTSMDPEKGEVDIRSSYVVSMTGVGASVSLGKDEMHGGDGIRCRDRISPDALRVDHPVVIRAQKSRYGGGFTLAVRRIP